MAAWADFNNADAWMGSILATNGCCGDLLDWAAKNGSWRGRSMERLDWLLDSDPAIRWQALRDLAGASAEEVTAERARMTTEGWVAQLLALEDADGQWARGACFPGEGYAWQKGERGQPWLSTLHILQLLKEFGVDPGCEPMRRAVALVRENCKWEHAGEAFFDGEVEPCINGRVVMLGAYFGVPVDAVVERLIGEQLADGGWNCEVENGSVRSSFHTTINVLEGLAEFERAVGGTADSIAARQRGEEYLLERELFHRLSTGAVIDSKWMEFSFPVRWRYDVLRGLDYFRAAGVAPEERMRKAVELVRSKRQEDGSWLLENTHPGAVWFALENGDGRASRWNTLRALRVLRWWDGA
jgi:hypothetical protein